MSDQENRDTVSEASTRSPWERPEMHRLDADAAEGAAGTPRGDNTFYS
jgi:hypothetical protein